MLNQAHRHTKHTHKERKSHTSHTDTDKPQPQEHQIWVHSKPLVMSVQVLIAVYLPAEVIISTHYSSETLNLLLCIRIMVCQHHRGYWYWGLVVEAGLWWKVEYLGIHPEFRRLFREAMECQNRASCISHNNTTAFVILVE